VLAVVHDHVGPARGRRLTLYPSIIGLRCVAAARATAAFAKVAKNQPAAYMKICASLVPREFKVEHTQGVRLP
jgi:hypothetical protein